MFKGNLTVPMGWQRWQFAERGKAENQKAYLRRQCLNCLHRTKKRLASDSDTNVWFKKLFFLSHAAWEPYSYSRFGMASGFMLGITQGVPSCQWQLRTAVLVYSWFKMIPCTSTWGEESVEDKWNTVNSPLFYLYPALHHQQISRMNNGLQRLEIRDELEHP